MKCADFENDVAAKVWTWNSRFILQLKVGHFSKNTTSARPIDRYRDIKRRMSFSIPVGLPPGARWLHEKLEYPRDAGAPGVILYFWTPWQRCNLSFPPKNVIRALHKVWLITLSIRSTEVIESIDCQATRIRTGKYKKWIQFLPADERWLLVWPLAAASGNDG